MVSRTSSDRPPRFRADKPARKPPWRFVLTVAFLLSAAWQVAAMTAAPAPAPVPTPVPAAFRAATIVAPAPGAERRRAALLVPGTGPNGNGARLITPGGGELSLQETLDQLGYTVNVPVEHGSQPLTPQRPYRTSTRSDAVNAETFTGDGDAAFRILSQQAMLAGTTVFGIQGASSGDGVQETLLRPAARGYGLWLSNNNGPAGTRFVPGGENVRFFIRDTQDSFHLGALTSRAADNQGNGSQVIVLPALSGGTWVDEDDNTGHWENSDASQGYLLCWEDSRWDADYQDMVVLIQNVHPLAQ